MKYTHVFITTDQKVFAKCTEQEFHIILRLFRENEHWVNLMKRSKECTIYSHEYEMVDTTLKQIRFNKQIDNYVDKL